MKQPELSKTFISVNTTYLPTILASYRLHLYLWIATPWVRGGCEVVKFVCWFIMSLVVKAQNDWRDVGWPQVAVHRNNISF